VNRPRRERNHADLHPSSLLSLPQRNLNKHGGASDDIQPPSGATRSRTMSELPSEDGRLDDDQSDENQLDDDQPNDDHSDDNGSDDDQSHENQSGHSSED